MKPTPLSIMTPRAFTPLLKATRYKGLWGGRGSGKSHFFAELLVEQATLRPGLRAVCIREIQKSLSMSVRQLISDKIHTFGLNEHFTILDKEIRTPGNGIIIFQGMQNHTADSIKSLEGFDIAWVEEAQSLSAHSLKLLRPTIRKPQSEIWFSWNPNHPTDPVDQFMRSPAAQRDPDIITRHVTWSDNPWFPEILNAERLRDKTHRSDEYDHIWEGNYQQKSNAIIFTQRVEVTDFNTPAHAHFYFGVDWGFARDPTALIRCFITDDILHIDYEAGGTAIALDALPALFNQIPAIKNWPIKADNARPETINYLKTRHNFRISAAKKWPGSVHDGIERLKAFQKIRIHPRCVETAREFRLYRYKIDPLTGDVLPLIEDANNHYIDALRYALDGLMTNQRSLPDFSAFAPKH